MKTFLIIIFIILIIVIILLMKHHEHFTSQSILKQPKYYFDNNATTFINDERVLNEIIDNLNTTNPSNKLHYLGQNASKKLEECRKKVADDLKVNSEEIYFTGCATESNNIIINDIVNNWLVNNKGQATIITDNIEHGSIYHILDNLKINNRINIVKIKIDTNKKSKYYGSVNPKDVEYALDNNENVILMTFMWVNNETGAINPIKELGLLASAYKVFFHSDATQAIPKMIIHPYEYKVNALTFSGHKFYGPKGVGCLFIQSRCPMFDKSTQEICSNFRINSQEHGVRGGTENIAFIAGMSKALKIVHENRDKKNMRLKAMKDYIIDQLTYHGCEIIKPFKSVDNTILVILKGISCCNKTFTKKLSDNYKICVGTSSACLTNNEKSHVMDAMCIKDCYSDKVIRISIGDFNTEHEVKYLVKSIVELLRIERKTPVFNEN